MGSLLLDTALLKKASDFLNVLDNQIRWDLLKALHGKGSMTVTELYIQLRMEQPQASQYLGNLRNASFVTTSRKGKYIYYSLNYEILEKVGGIINGFLEENGPNYIKVYKAYVQSIIPFFKPAPYLENYKGMQTWLRSFSQKLRAYILAIGKKKKELLKAAKNEGKVDIEKLREALEKSRLESLKAFIQHYKP